MVEEPRQRSDAGPADDPIRRLEAHATTEAGRDTDAAAGVGADGGGRQSRHDGGSRPAAGPARDALVIPRVHRGAVGLGVRRDDPVRQLVGGELAQQHRTGLPQAPRHRGIVLRDPALVGGRARGRWDARRVDQVLEADRDAVERAPQPTLAHLVGQRTRVGSGPLGRDRHEGRQLRVQLLDAGQVRLGQLDGRQLTVRHRGRRVAERQFRGIAHQCLLGDPYDRPLRRSHECDA